MKDNHGLTFDYLRDLVSEIRHSRKLAALPSRSEEGAVNDRAYVVKVTEDLRTLWPHRHNCACGRSSYGVPVPVPRTDLDWQDSAQRYLARLGAAEYDAFRATRRMKSQRFAPSGYHRALVDLLGQNDEEGFKATKAGHGATGALGF